MIQFKRGKTDSWRKQKKPLAAGQPGYDKDKHKIKIGDGEKSWAELPYASGLSSEEILSSEKEAKARRKAAILLNPLSALFDSPAIITYGEEGPDKNTVGQLYLQTFDDEPEVDYIISSGRDGVWTYQIWKSGIAKCWGNIKLTTTIQSAFDKEYLYCDESAMKRMTYPIPFTEAPSETATLKSSDGMIAWLANRSGNTAKTTGLYNIISPDKHNNKTYYIALDVKGYVDKDAWKK